MSPVDRGVEDREPRTTREDGLEADRPVRISRLPSRRCHRRRTWTRRNAGAGTPSRWSSSYVSALSFERRIVSGFGEHRHGKALAVLREGLGGRTTTAAAPRPRPLARQHRGSRQGSRGQSSRHEVERVAQVSSTDRSDMSVPTGRTFQFAVVAEGAQKRCGARRARRRDEDGDRPHGISILSAPKLVDSPGVLGLQQRAHRLGHRRSLVDPDLGVGQQLEPGERTGVQLVVRAPMAPVLVQSERYVPGAKYGGAITLAAPSNGAVILQVGVVPRQHGVEPVVELHVGRPHGARRGARVAQAQ